MTTFEDVFGFFVLADIGYEMNTKHNQNWHVYILRCADNTLYTGITTDLDRRVEQHQSRQGAKYTKTRAPVRLVYSEPQESRSTATKRELEIKALSRAQKLSLAESFTAE